MGCSRVTPQLEGGKKHQHVPKGKKTLMEHMEMEVEKQ
jgi:hypothetical protein